MHYTKGMMAQMTFGGDRVLLSFAIFLGVLFIVLLVLDRKMRRGGRRRRRREPETLGQKLRKPFTNMRALHGELKRTFQERSRRHHGRGRRPPQGPW